MHSNSAILAFTNTRPKASSHLCDEHVSVFFHTFFIFLTLDSEILDAKRIVLQRERQTLTPSLTTITGVRPDRADGCQSRVG